MSVSIVATVANGSVNCCRLFQTVVCDRFSRSRQFNRRPGTSYGEQTAIACRNGNGSGRTGVERGVDSHSPRRRAWGVSAGVQCPFDSLSCALFGHLVGCLRPDSHPALWRCRLERRVDVGSYRVLHRFAGSRPAFCEKAVTLIVIRDTTSETVRFVDTGRRSGVPSPSEPHSFGVH